MSTPNLLTLAPAGRREVRQSLARARVPRREFRSLCEAMFARCSCSASSTPASCALHELALKAGWDRVHPALRLTQPFYDRFTPAISARDFACGRAARAGARLRRRAAAMSPDRGGLALVLHSHMPYVEGFGTWPFGEEWLWEAVATVYLPLLDLLDGAPVTVGLTPVLCDQFEALRGPAADRYLLPARDPRRHPRPRTRAASTPFPQPGLAAEVRRAAGDYTRGGSASWRRGRDLVRALPRWSATAVELWTSSASHAVLPLIATEPGRRLQLATGVASHERRFGSFGGGFWLPECAYEPGLERELADFGVRAFCVDQTAVNGYGGPDNLEPVATEAGPVAVPIDWQTVELVWCKASGYPAAAAYRDYHHRTTHDLRPWNSAREPYRHEEALALAREHARDFVQRAIARLDAHAPERGRPGLLTCALDTELLGHWWYEGQPWLAGVLEEAEDAGLELLTLLRGPRAGAGGAAGAARRRAGARARTCPPGTRRRWPRSPSRRARPSCARWPRPPPADATTAASSAPPASCWPCNRATGPSR